MPLREVVQWRGIGTAKLDRATVEQHARREYEVLLSDNTIHGAEQRGIELAAPEDWLTGTALLPHSPQTLQYVRKQFEQCGGMAFTQPRLLTGGTPPPAGVLEVDGGRFAHARTVENYGRKYVYLPRDAPVQV